VRHPKLRQLQEEGPSAPELWTPQDLEGSLGLGAELEMKTKKEM